MEIKEIDHGKTQYFCECGHTNLDHLDGHCTLCLCLELKPCEE